HKLHVYLDQSDEHSEYFVKNTLQYIDERENENPDMDLLLSHFLGMDAERLNVIEVSENVMVKETYEHFEDTIKNLYEFIHIFKADLKGIEIDRKEDHDVYICSLIMIYDSYKIHAEFESTGIKKLIKLYAYFREIVRGGIVFIDEFDSNLHDVYLCALLEYLMEYAEGQLCFTTHNVGPMDILKKHKKSIDFLSIDGKIYPWVTNGNYSPSKLYRNGMIEGSPFNVDSIDFIGIFGLNEEEE
ncbi:AAA family ATPase, partial [Faecalimonas sp.]